MYISERWQKMVASCSTDEFHPDISSETWVPAFREVNVVGFPLGGSFCAFLYISTEYGPGYLRMRVDKSGVAK